MTTKICSRDCGLTILDIDNRFFATNRKINGAKSLRASFYNVENYRFLQNYSIEVAENQRKKSVFNVLSPPIIKNLKIGGEIFPSFFDFKCADRQKFSKKSIFSNFDFRAFDILSWKSI